MNLSLPPQILKLIEDRVRSGKYQSPEEVISAALGHLEQQGQIGDFDAGELDRLLARGEQSGTPLDGEAVTASMRRR
jgi:putative addiction module CopG family antidote